MSLAPNSRVVTKLAMAAATATIFGVQLFAHAQVGSSTPAEVVVFVSTKGDDALDGRAPEVNKNAGVGPVASFARAKELVRATRATHPKPLPASIVVRGGTYVLDAPLTFGPEDSSTQAPLRIAAFAGEIPVLLGTSSITVLTVAKSQRITVQLDPKKFFNRRPLRAFLDRQPMVLARYPNESSGQDCNGEWALVDGEAYSMHTTRPGESKRRIAIRQRDWHEWNEGAQDAEVVIFPRFNWYNDIVPVAELNRGQRALFLARDTFYDIRPGDRYFVQNHPAELDSPGEWYFDRKSAQFQFWPYSDSKIGSPITATNLVDLILSDKAAGLEIRGLTLEGAEGAAIKVSDCSECKIIGNTIRHAALRGRGSYAVVVKGGRAVRVAGNDFEQIGGTALLLQGGDREALVESGHVADNNFIRKTGEIFKQGVGIELVGVGQLVRHNLIEQTPRMGIIMSGNKHVVERNLLQFTSLETSDTGAIYLSGRDPLDSRGSVIRENIILDNVGCAFDSQGNRWLPNKAAIGVYLDDHASGVDVLSNVIGRSSWASIMINGGTENRIVGNIIYGFDDTAIQLIARGRPALSKSEMDRVRAATNQLGWRSLRGLENLMRDDTKSLSGTRLEQNLVFGFGKSSKFLSSRGVDWSVVTVVGNTLQSSDRVEIAIDGKSIGMNEARRLYRVDAESMTEGPPPNQTMLDWARSNAADSLRSKPPAEIGLYRSEERASWPVRSRVRNDVRLP